MFAVLQPTSSRRVSSSPILHFRVRKEQEERGASFGRGTAEQTEGTEGEREREREREDQEGGETLSFSLSVPRNLSKPIYLGPLALRALWVLSFGDR